MRWVFPLLAVFTLAPSPVLAWLHYYSEKDQGTVLGFYGTNADESPVMFTTVAAAPDQVRTGIYSLKLEGNMADGTPQAFLANVWDLQPNDTDLPCSGDRM